MEPSIAAAVERALQPENWIVLAENTSRPHRLVSETARIVDRPSWDGKRKAPDPIELRRRRILSAIETGVTNPAFLTLIGIADALELHVSDLLTNLR